MDTNKLKRFATEARNKIRRGVEKKLLALGFNEEGEPSSFPQQLQGATLYRGQQLEEEFYSQWISLYEAIQRHGVKQVYEEVAYTWFNRLVAIRILQKNGFIDRVLTFDNPTIRVPHIVSEARQGRFPEMDTAMRLRLRSVINDPSKTYEQFSLLITAFCHDNRIISTCFGAINDYTSLLLPDDILDADGFVDMLNQADYISDEDYRTTELLGWLYQFYISERKDAVFARKGKFESDEIPAATQIFTPNWIVKYMVQNTLGRIWLDNNPGDALENKMPYLVPKAESGNEDGVCHYSSLEDIKVIDPACGSGHILLEAFDLLYDMYLAEFYSREEAITCIFTQNLVGIDLDTRAKQLATFALLLKACQRDKSFLDVPVRPRVLDMPEAYDESLYGSLDEFIDLFCNAPEHETPTEDDKEEIRAALELMKDADTLGTIMKFQLSDHTRLVIRESLDYWSRETMRRKQVVVYRPAFELMLALTDKYTCVIANPPYMGSGNMNSVLSKYVKDNYEEAKADLFSVFMQMGMERLAFGGKMAQINMQSWMFLSSFERLRDIFLHQYIIDSMLHLGPRTFDELSGEVVQNTAFVLTKPCLSEYGMMTIEELAEKSEEERKVIVSKLIEETESDDFQKVVREAKGTYYRLVDGKNCADKEQLFLSHIHGNEDGNRIYYPNVEQKNFEKIPGSPIGYWVSEKIFAIFANNRKLAKVLTTREGMAPANNAKFLKLWFEVNKQYISLFNSNSDKWYPYIKGGTYRKWSGNQEYIVDWANNGYDIKNNIDEKTGRVRSHNYNGEFAFQEAVCWTVISFGKVALRYTPKGFLWDSAGASGFSKTHLFYCLALVNSVVAKSFLSVLSPSTKLNVGEVVNIPLIERNISEIDAISKNSINISKQDWDSHETSWDFQCNELLSVDYQTYMDNINNYIENHYKETGERLCIDPAAPKLDSLAWRMGQYKQKWEYKFAQLHENEEDLNRQFISIYGLEDELSPDVPLNEITILQQGEIKITDQYALCDNDGMIFTDSDGAILTTSGKTHIEWQDDVIIKQFISYAIGCMMGRYSLDKPGLILANQGDGVAQYNQLVPNSRFAIDDDGILPLMDDNSPFSDNAVSRMAEFVKTAFGADRLTQNLNYMEQALGKSLSDYLQKDFWKDHKRMYQNRPIYWLFASKKGAFRVLVYMHRMDAYTVGKVRNQYLLPYIEWLKQRIDELMARQAELSAPERKQLKDYGKSLEECREYDVRLHEVANLQISIDLDDGVLVNYAKYGDVLHKLK